MTKEIMPRAQWLEWMASVIAGHLANGDKATASKIIADEMRKVRGNPVAAIVATLFDGSHPDGFSVEIKGGKRGKRRRDDFEFMQDAICRLVIDEGEPLEAALAAISAEFSYSRSSVHAAYKDREESWVRTREMEKRWREDPELAPYLSSDLSPE